MGDFDLKNRRSRPATAARRNGGGHADGTDLQIGEELPVETAQLRKRTHFGSGCAAREKLWHHWV